MKQYLRKSIKSKDGYVWNGANIDIPKDFALKCDNKHIRLLSKSISHFVTADILKSIDSSGNVEYEQGNEVAYSTYEIHSVYIYMSKRKRLGC